MSVLRRIAAGLTYSNVVATLALFIALGGASVAAVRISSRHIVNDSVRSADLRTGSVQSSDIRNGTIRSSDVRRGALGSAAIRRLKAEDFAAGQLPDPIPAVLPSRKTLRGVFSASVTGGGDDQSIARGPVPFAIPLSRAPLVVYVAEGTPPPAACPGSAAEPQAAPGILCMFESKAVGTIVARGPFNPISGVNFSASRFGALVFVNGSAGAAVRGTWAVTAP